MDAAYKNIIIYIDSCYFFETDNIVMAYGFDINNACKPCVILYNKKKDVYMQRHQQSAAANYSTVNPQQYQQQTHHYQQPNQIVLNDELCLPLKKQRRRYQTKTEQPYYIKINKRKDNTISFSTPLLTKNAHGNSNYNIFSKKFTSHLNLFSEDDAINTALNTSSPPSLSQSSTSLVSSYTQSSYFTPEFKASVQLSDNEEISTNNNIGKQLVTVPKSSTLVKFLFSSPSSSTSSSPINDDNDSVFDNDDCWSVSLGNLDTDGYLVIYNENWAYFLNICITIYLKLMHLHFDNEFLLFANETCKYYLKRGSNNELLFLISNKMNNINLNTNDLCMLFKSKDHLKFYNEQLHKKILTIYKDVINCNEKFKASF